MLLSSSSMETKAKAIVLVFSVITIFLTVSSFVFLEFTKNDFDMLFEKRTASVAKLHAIKDYFTMNIADTISGVESKSVEKDSAKIVLNQAEYLVQNRWSEYKNIIFMATDRSNRPNILQKITTKYFATPTNIDFHIDDKEFIENLDTELQSVLGLIKPYLEGKSDNSAIIIARSNNISSRLSQLIDLHLQSAFMEKQHTDEMYSVGFKIIATTFLIAMIVTMVSASIILKSVAQQSETLERIIKEKTFQLLKINQELEQIVEQQVSDGRKKDAIMQSQAKLAAMGEVIANIAHQWRQPLNALAAIIQSFRLKKLSGSLSDYFVDEQVNSGLEIASKMSNTIQDFRNFFRPESEQKQFQLSKSINSAISFFKTCNIDSNITVETKYTADENVVGYEGSFTQVVLNALNNSKDAINSHKHNNGLIVVKTKKRIIKNRCFVAIYILDNGEGFDEAILERVFEPYFTTKHQNVGTGLGLYMSKKIVEDYMDGSLEACNFRLKGSVYGCLKITLPIMCESSKLISE